MEEKELERAKNAVYRYLSYRPRSCAEVENKLREKEYGEAIVKAVLSDLVRFGYLDDEKFAEQWARSRVRLRGFGRSRIERELRGKGVGRDVIREALAGVFEDVSELDVARREAEKKSRSLARLDPETRRRRLAGFLERKGFCFETIQAILRDTRAGSPAE